MGNPAALQSFNTIVPIGSLIIAFATVFVTAFLMQRQAREMAHERNALAILEAIDRLTSQELVQAFNSLADVAQRYPTDADFAANYPGSKDETANVVVGQLMVTIACLARREVLDASLIVDAVGYMIRKRLAAIQPLCRLENNIYIYENFEWLAKYSDWWKDIPRPKHPNYDPAQFSKGRGRQ